ncbi:hypothetical protein DMB66_29310 [Actinoplanes sp. ATCC 53533]|uniref:hypothetical protein n=1 Tax=Actinoplanes sp. ATCC 53533 TaxID=1288362 RepID=UPI000F767394|nr:hypothetical protein [Actinoplanes sp. ATCC 53533]RSM58373.1 hypothetical protein DMB66_29310 [Actinoplanes sp. ATCC 53533]
MESKSAEDLAIIAAARAAVADRLITPMWYHPIFGLLLAGYVLGVSLGDTTARLITSLLFAGGCLALASAYRRLTGVWISGFEAGPASRWAVALGVLLGALVAAGWAITYWTGLSWPAWCLAAVAFAAGNVLGRKFDTALRAQLRAGL